MSALAGRPYDANMPAIVWSMYLVAVALYCAPMLIGFRVLQGAAGGLLAPMMQLMMARHAGPHLARVVGTAAMPVIVAIRGLTGKPRSRSQVSAAWCESNAMPSCAPRAYAQNASGRSAVTAGSCWRSDPAAVLRGFM